jgi:hypothetical protein
MQDEFVIYLDQILDSQIPLRLRECEGAEEVVMAVHPTSSSACLQRPIQPEVGPQAVLVPQRWTDAAFPVQSPTEVLVNQVGNREDCKFSHSS